MGRLLIAGGRVIDPHSGFDGIADVAVEGDRIAAIGPDLDRTPADAIFDAQGCIVTPGLIDPHVHLREPGHEHKETIATGTAAAVAGGFTSVCCMPNTLPALDTPEAIRFILERARSTAHCRVFPVAAGTVGRKGEHPAEIGLLAREGAVAFSDDGDAIPTAGVMSKVLRLVEATGRAFMQHCQDPTMTQGAAMHSGSIAIRLGLTGWPREAEEVIVERDLRVNRPIGCAYHVQHISSAGTVEIVRRARAEGLPVTAEATPHHMLLTHEACEGYATAAKVNPPLREASDARAIVEGVAEGVITVLGTDHAPHAPHEKALEFENAPMGMIGLETAVALYLEALVHSGAIGLPRLIALMTVEPARLCGLLGQGLGMLTVGGPADITIIDPAHEWTVQERDLAGKSRNTPFLGRAVRGRAIGTIIGGTVRHHLHRAPTEG
ncbi:MAG: dihydroorotase [Phycisphaeraceae bacterium]|nr:dihydroorotase [Phycisphaeraceae bacterium]